MRRLLVVIGLFTLLLAALTPATSAFGEFIAKEAKEGSVTLEAKESFSFTIGTKYELKCGTVKGEGAPMDKPGITLNEAKEDEAPATPSARATQIDLKISFEKCTAKVGEKSLEASVNSEKCRLEIFSDTISESKGQGLVSLPTAKNETACTLTIKAGECSVEIGNKAEREQENVMLSALKLKSVKEFEGEIESGSEVKGVGAKVVNCEGTAEKSEGAFHFSKGVTIKGASLVNADLDLEPNSHDFKTQKKLTGSGEFVINFTANKLLLLEETKVFGVDFGFPKNGCGVNKVMKVADKCQIGTNFFPVTAGFKLGFVLVKYETGGFKTVTLASLNGQGTV
jgi:hypothetical protein